jgi:hypothetical protein
VILFRTIKIWDLLEIIVIINQMLKILSGTFFVVLTLVIITYASGLRSGSTIDTDFQFQLGYSQEYIYEIITDIEEYPNRKKDLEVVEILEKKGSTITSWREKYKNGSWKEFKILEKNFPNYFKYEIFDSSNGYVSIITYYLEEDNSFTTIYLDEEGQIPGTFLRGLRFLSGDNSFLKKEAKWIRVAIQTEQIERR